MSVFLKPLVVKPEKIPLPEFGADACVWCRPLTAKELIELQGKHGPEGSGFDFNCDFLLKVLCHENGTPQFASFEDSKEQVSNLPLPSMDRLVKAALDVSAITHTDDEKKS